MSLANVVATIESPASHHGTERPEAKNSEVSLPDLFAKKSAGTKQTAMVSRTMIQSIVCRCIGFEPKGRYGCQNAAQDKTALILVRLPRGLPGDQPCHFLVSECPTLEISGDGLIKPDSVYSGQQRTGNFELCHRNSKDATARASWKIPGMPGVSQEILNPPDTKCRL